MWRERKEIEAVSVCVRPSRHRFFYLPPDKPFFAHNYTNAHSFLTRPPFYSPFRGRQRNNHVHTSTYLPLSVCRTTENQTCVPFLTCTPSLGHYRLQNTRCCRTPQRTEPQNRTILSSTKTWRHHSKLCHSASLAVTSPLHTPGHATHDFVPCTLLCQ